MLVSVHVCMCMCVCVCAFNFAYGLVGIAGILQAALKVTLRLGVIGPLEGSVRERFLGKEAQVRKKKRDKRRYEKKRNESLCRVVVTHTRA